MDLFGIVKEFWWAVLLSVFALVFIISAWDKIRWKVMNYWYGFPLIGKVSRLSGDTKMDRSNPGWLKSERALCADYKKFIGVQSKAEFERYISYLNRAGDTGRGTTPAFVWLLIVGLVIVEALGFSYVLAGFAVPGASAQVQLYGSIGIAFVISVLLVWFTHLSGAELFVNSVVSSARQHWNSQGQKGNISRVIDIDISENNEDDNDPGHAQTLHRTRKKKVSYPITMGTLIFVVIIAIGSTYVRSTVLEKQLIEDVSGVQTNYYGVPAELSQAASASESKAHGESLDLERKGGWTTFIILAVLFVFIQFLGILFGYKWGFAGKQSKEAYAGLGKGRYSTYEDVLQHKDVVIDEAQARLENLQQKLEYKNANSGGSAIKTHKTFEDFLLETAQSRHANKQKTDSIGTDSIEESVIVSTVEIANAVQDEETELRAKLADLKKAKVVEDLRRELAAAEQT